MSLRALKWLVLGAFVSDLALAEQAAQPPSLELLEYLGMLVDDNGELIGPTDFEEQVIKRDDVIQPDVIDEKADNHD